MVSPWREKGNGLLELQCSVAFYEAWLRLDRVETNPNVVIPDAEIYHHEGNWAGFPGRMGRKTFELRSTKFARRVPVFCRPLACHLMPMALPNRREVARLGRWLSGFSVAFFLTACQRQTSRQSMHSRRGQTSANKQKSVLNVLSPSKLFWPPHLCGGF